MKKIKILVASILILSSVTTQAQWSNTGDSKTTGSLTVGSTVEGSSSRITLQGPVNGINYRDIWFDFIGGAGKAVIRGYRGGAWKTGNLEFLATDQNGTLVKRMHIDDYAKTVFFDKEVLIGEHKSESQFKVEEGNRLYFGGTAYNTNGGFYFAKYTRESRKSDLRLALGDASSGYNRFVIGNTLYGSSAFRHLVVVSDNGNVGIGTESTSTYKLAVNGTIRAKEIRVDTGWADFVFQPDYELPTLEEVKAHIDENGHLPGIPSEAEVRENGVGLADMTTKLLQKVEELTLYAIQQNEIIEKQSQEIEELKQAITSKK